MEQRDWVGDAGICRCSSSPFSSLSQLIDQIPGNRQTGQIFTVDAREIKTTVIFLYTHGNGIHDPLVASAALGCRKGLWAS